MKATITIEISVEEFEAEVAKRMADDEYTSRTWETPRLSAVWDTLSSYSCAIRIRQDLTEVTKRILVGGADCQYACIAFNGSTHYGLALMVNGQEVDDICFE